MGYPGLEGERDILRSSRDRDGLEELEPVVAPGEIRNWQDAVRNVRVEDSLVDYMLRLVTRTREHEHLALGVSPRGSQALYRGVQALALLESRSYSIPDDIKRLAIPAFAHRVVVSTRYASTLKKSEQAESIIHDILETTSIPL
jgi:MoxR-like ATPase